MEADFLQEQLEAGVAESSEDSETMADLAVANAGLAMAKTKSRSPSREAAEEGKLIVDVFENENELVVKATVAGVTADEMDISITNEVVTITGTRKTDEKIKTSDYHYQELYWGKFSRSIILPEEVDADSAKATLKNGILTIRMPKLSKTRIKKLKVSS